MSASPEFRTSSRRISLLVLSGVPIPRVSAYVGHARSSMMLDTYSHVMLEPTELDYAAALFYIPCTPCTQHVRAGVLSRPLIWLR